METTFEKAGIRDVLNLGNTVVVKCNDNVYGLNAFDIGSLCMVVVEQCRKCTVCDIMSDPSN
jgi:hypothetical protein